MPTGGANTLGDLRQRKLRISCAKCGLRKQFDVAALIERCGRDAKLPTLKDKLTRCDKLDVGRLHDYCKAMYDEVNV